MVRASPGICRHQAAEYADDALANPCRSCAPTPAFGWQTSVVNIATRHKQGIETGSGFNSLVYSTREMAVGYDSARNRVGALAIAEKAGVTPVMLKEAPKLQC